MTINDSRSLNGQMHRGATDGKVRSTRPDTAAADFTSATERARQLHPAHYGSMGRTGDNSDAFLDEFMPDSAVRGVRRGSGQRGY